MSKHITGDPTYLERGLDGPQEDISLHKWHVSYDLVDAEPSRAGRGGQRWKKWSIKGELHEIVLKKERASCFRSRNKVRGFVE